MPRAARPALAAGVALLAALAARPAPAAPSAQPAPARGDWPTPRQAATGNADDDPVAAKLLVYLRLLSPARSSADEYATFLTENPSWPQRALLLARFQQALAAEPDNAAAGRLCAAQPLTDAHALLRCASATPRPAGLDAQARATWVNRADTPAEAQTLLTGFGTVLTPQDHWQRFDRQERAGRVDAAARQVPMLDPAQQVVARARLALRRNDPQAEAVLATVPDGQQADAALVFDHLRWLHHAQRLDEALALWHARGVAAEKEVPPTIAAGFWRERDGLARDLLLAHRTADALFMASDSADIGSANHYDALFLSGWIRLQYLHDARHAVTDFTPLAQAVPVITRSRGLFWAGRALAAEGHAAAARAQWEQAATLANTFYGQMAIAWLGGNAMNPLLVPEQAGRQIRAYLLRQSEPTPSVADSVRFDTTDLARAAEILVAWGDRRHARDFILALDAQSTSTIDHVLAARMATRLGIPDAAVMVARLAGRDGLTLVHEGWPRTYTPPTSILPADVELAVARQESGFDAAVVSPAHAVGLMQLLVPTAREMARKAGLPATRVSAESLTDPQLNMQLGAAYLAEIAQRMGGAVPYVAAAYNAGPHRTDTWLLTLGNPARDTPVPDAMLDWIESIPFGETRNYVERVEENMAIYQATDPALGQG
ncbi:lytic transglycosylase domain-containing protein [Komagataeibacter rhaeticus]|uniref:lytic transglycosylase domain-containing protein n=3 Tax=Komagataeibacter rhaeticus TaxID=215221 RepID=UPI0004DA0A17|nr:lytic transglycosylase domain-containing protein [Komagataeibacter rhaeticus]KDU97020.1 murein transglycosylase [Komagataeibacter rhaeticus AF1]MBL7238770.1 lytic transglycosylase domain-containing protein [Komagataeibacter rhaeticus]